MRVTPIIKLIVTAYFSPQLHGTGSLVKACLPRMLASISTASANSSGHRRFVSTHLERDWKGQATQAERSRGLSYRSLPPVHAVPAGHASLYQRVAVPYPPVAGRLHAYRLVGGDAQPQLDADA